MRIARMEIIRERKRERERVTEKERMKAHRTRLRKCF